MILAPSDEGSNPRHLIPDTVATGRDPRGTTLNSGELQDGGARVYAGYRCKTCGNGSCDSEMLSYELCIGESRRGFRCAAIFVRVVTGQVTFGTRSRVANSAVRPAADELLQLASEQARDKARAFTCVAGWLDEMR